MFQNFINIKNIFSFLRSAIYLCTSFGYFFALNGFMLGLCWGHNLHFGQLGPFDVLLQSLPIVSSHLLSSLPSSLSLSAFCWPLTSCLWWIHTHALLDFGVWDHSREGSNVCAVASPSSTLVSFFCTPIAFYHVASYSFKGRLENL